MATGDYARPPHSFPSFDRRESENFEEAELRGPSRSDFHPGGDDAWQGPDRLREAEWHGANREEGRNFAPSDGQGIPPGPNMRGRGVPYREGRGRGDFGRGSDFGRGRGEFGRGDFGRAGGFMPRGRGEYGGRGRGWGDDSNPYSGRGRGFGEPLGRGEGGLRGFRGRGEFGRGRADFGRFGGRQGWEGRGRRGPYGERPAQPDIDPALLERRRASTAALLKRQVAQLQVSKDLLGKDESAALYAKIMDQDPDQPHINIRNLYSFPAFSVEESSTVPSNLPSAAEEMQAFEQCLQLYQEAQSGCNVVQSEHGNFLLPMGT